VRCIGAPKAVLRMAFIFTWAGAGFHFDGNSFFDTVNILGPAILGQGNLTGFLGNGTNMVPPW
jgi:hypothetical protein